VLDGRFQKPLDLGERNDFIEAGFDLAAGHAENRAAEIYVFTATELRVKSRSHFQQRTNRAANAEIALTRLGDARQEPQQGCFSRAVVADHA
jgi:hypothetical protein